MSTVAGPPPSADRLRIVYGPELTTYSFGPDHPLRADRYVLTMRLLSALGWLDRPLVDIETPRSATLSELLPVHSYAYVQAVQQGQAIAQGRCAPVDLTVYGLGTPDDPLFPHIHDAAALYTGATIQAMNALLEGEVTHAYSPAGGQHHAHRAEASGFCVYNDCAAAIAVALQAGRRVAYLDLDAHHGDGVQEAFYDNPRVLTISIHESGQYLFPGTGETSELGIGEGRGTSLNIPLPPFAGDQAFLQAFERIIEPAVRAYRPDILFCQTGVDTHHSDPLTHLNAGLSLYPELADRLHQLAHEVCSGRWLIAGGGGYDSANMAPRAWTAFIGTVLGHDVSKVRLPDEWLQASRAAGGEPPLFLLEDPGPNPVMLDRLDIDPILEEIERTALKELLARTSR